MSDPDSRRLYDQGGEAALKRDAQRGEAAQRAEAEENKARTATAERATGKRWVAVL